MRQRQPHHRSTGNGFLEKIRFSLAIVALGFGSATSAMEPVNPYGSNPAAGHALQVNGIKLYHEVYGTGAPLVVLHGNGGSIAALRYQIDFFRSNRRVIAIDSRGHGRSEMGSGRLTYLQMADDVAALLGQLHSAPADVIGWSDGGIIALLLARHHPAAVRRIVASGANLSPEALEAGELTSLTAELRSAEQMLAAGDRSRSWEVVRQHLQLMVTQPQITTSDLKKITAPVLVLAGEHDSIPAGHTRAIADGLPHARLHIFPGASHGALQEFPELFNATVAEFLETPSVTTGARAMRQDAPAVFHASTEPRLPPKPFDPS